MVNCYQVSSFAKIIGRSREWLYQQWATDRGPPRSHGLARCIPLSPATIAWAQSRGLTDAVRHLKVAKIMADLKRPSAMERLEALAAEGRIADTKPKPKARPNAEPAKVGWFGAFPAQPRAPSGDG